MQKINFSSDLSRVEKIPTRQGYGEGLAEAGAKNADIVALGADITGSVKIDIFRDRFPDRFLSIGIAEQNQIGIAAGLSLAGKIPFLIAATLFTYRRLQQSESISTLRRRLLL